MPCRELETPTIRPRLTVVNALEQLPRNLRARLPYLWSQVLFPGRAQTPGVWRWAPLLILTVVAAALLFTNLSFFLFEPDEGRYAQIPREMLTRGEWIVPTHQGEPYLDKPPLFYWLVMAAYQVFGYHDWAGRLVPAFAVLGSVLMTYLFGRRLVGERAAFWGALALALMPGFVGMGRMLLLDGVLTFWVTLAVFSALRAVEGAALNYRWWTLTALATGLGVLTKGPVALVLVVPPLWLYGRLATCTRVGRSGWLLFGGIVLAVALPWYIAVCMHVPEFARHFLLVHNVQRYVEPFDHAHPFWYYVPILLIGLFPLTLMLISFCRFLFSGDGSKRPPALGYLLLASGWCILFFSISGSKLPTYVLPAFPPLALALGVFVAQASWNGSRWFRYSLGFWLLASIVGHGILLPGVAYARSPMADWDRMMALCGNKAVPVYCFPRHIDSVAFYTGRADFVAIHTKDAQQLIGELKKSPRSIVLLGHRSSLAGLNYYLTSDLEIVETAPMGLCDAAVVERRP